MIGAALRRRPEVFWLGMILLVALCLRIAVRAASGPAFFWENSYAFYFSLAEQIARGHGYAYLDGRPATFRVPLYPMFLAAVTHGEKAFWPLTVAQALASTGTVACAYGIGRLLFDRRTGMVAAAIAAFYPYYAWHDTALQETGLLTFLTALAMLLLLATQGTRSHWLAAVAGLAIGLAILIRPIVLPGFVFGIAWLLLPHAPGEAMARRIATVGLAGMLAIGTVAPWLVRNERITGHAVLGTEFGAALFYGNNDKTFSFYPTRSIDLSARAARDTLTAKEWQTINGFGTDEIGRSAWFESRAVAWIEAHPGRFLVAGVRKVVAAFGILPSPRHDWKADGLVAVTYGPILLLALIAMWRTRRRWRALVPLYVQFLCFAGVTAVLWGHSSHRAYLDVYLIVLAASTLVALWPRIRGVWPSARSPHPA